MCRTTREIRTTAIFRCVVTLKNGFHKTVRLTVDKVAEMCAALRQLRESPWLTTRYTEFFRNIEIDYMSVKSCKFINERTGEILLEI